MYEGQGTKIGVLVGALLVCILLLYLKPRAVLHQTTLAS
jgi:hypothetical protein